MNQTDEIVNQLTDYGELLATGLPFLAVGVGVVFLLHLLATRVLYPYLKNRRLAVVVFGALYVLVLVITFLLFVKRLGYDTQVLGQVSLLVVLAGAALTFFLAPYLPTLPFVIGNMVEIGGILGIVDTITPFHTHLRTFDGKTVFIPNAVVMASRIVNYHFTPTRRVDLELKITPESDSSQVRDRLLRLMSEQPQVLDDPAPSVLVTGADATGVQMAGYCWVKNADWVSARGELWVRIMEYFRGAESAAMALDTKGVVLSQPDAV